MKGLLFWVLLLLFLGAVAVIDHYAWKASSLQKYSGKFGGVTQPVDEAVNRLIEAPIKRQSLEELLSQAKTVEEYGKRSQELYEHLGKMNLPNAQFELMAETVKRYGRGVQRDANILKAGKFLAKEYAAQGKTDKLLPLLPWLHAVAIGPPVNEELAQEVIRWAVRAPRSVGWHTTSMTSTLPSVRRLKCSRPASLSKTT